MSKGDYISLPKQAMLLREYYKRALLKLVGRKPELDYKGCYCDIVEANSLIGNKIDSTTAFAAARFGANEFGIVVSYLKALGKWGHYSKNQTLMFCNNAGFFPNDKNRIDQFAELMIDSASEIDLIGVWNLHMEDYFVNNFMRDDVMVCELRALEPWYCVQSCWSQHLQGKRVLVVHPFSETIKTQYQKREQIFPGTNILPEFDLVTLKAVQSSAGQKDSRFSDWFEALEYMFEKALETSFDVAILGCGAYGFPLAAKLKKEGKQAIHLGGATQLLFGIKGKRWESIPHISSMFNEAWVRPQVNDRPEGANSVENGCYW